MSCKKMRVLTLSFCKVVESDERTTLEQVLFSSAPTLEELYSDSSLLKLLSADRIPKGPLFMFNWLWYLSLMVYFDKLSPTSGALQLIKSAPYLSKLEILVNATCDNYAAAVQKYLNTPASLDQPLNKLKHVLINWFRASDNELFFIKLLLAHTPSLVRMTMDLARSRS